MRSARPTEKGVPLACAAFLSLLRFPARSLRRTGGQHVTMDLFKTNGSSPPEREPDFPLIRQDTIFPLKPLTDAARAWAEQHLPADATRFGPAIVIEHRFVANITAGIARDGLTVESS
jgi:hypothetical protein